MDIRAMNGKKYVHIGNCDILNSVESTVIVRLNKKIQEFPLAISFFQSGRMNAADCLETARQFNLIRDLLSQIPPEMAVYDMRDLAKKAPWDGKISKVVTSCGNLYTTAEGGDLLFEIVSILTYGGIVGSDVEIC